MVPAAFVTVQVVPSGNVVPGQPANDRGGHTIADAPDHGGDSTSSFGVHRCSEKS